MSSAEYFEAAARPADATFKPADLLRLQRESGGASRVFEVLSREDDGTPLAWAVADLLSAAECDEVIQLAEGAGMEGSLISYRTAKRTRAYENQELADRVAGYLPQELKDKIKAADQAGLEVTGLHPNWRLVRYDTSDTFPAHYDQSDSKSIMLKDGSKDLYVSSHTLLINLTSPDSGTKGGATRFYPKGTYNFAVDVELPRGWGLVFLQKRLLHAGQALLSGCKYVAQAGIMRYLPPGMTFRPNIFSFGPGLKENEAEMITDGALESYQATHQNAVTNY